MTAWTSCLSLLSSATHERQGASDAHAPSKRCLRCSFSLLSPAATRGPDEQLPPFDERTLEAFASTERVKSPDLIPKSRAIKLQQSICSPSHLHQRLSRSPRPNTSHVLFEKPRKIREGAAKRASEKAKKDGIHTLMALEN
jgi:hypothetical protein